MNPTLIPGLLADCDNIAVAYSKRLPAGIESLPLNVADKVAFWTEHSFIGFIEDNDSDALVVLRGTDSLFEWTEDFEAWPTEFVDPGMKAEKGFVEVLDSITLDSGETINAWLSRITATKPVRIIGHSLGGAVANLLACYHGCQATTYACPLVGDSALKGYGDQNAKILNVINAPDRIPLLPAEYERAGQIFAIDSRTLPVPEGRPIESHLLATYRATIAQMQAKIAVDAVS